jgi:hypothetical protein
VQPDRTGTDPAGSRNFCQQSVFAKFQRSIIIIKQSRRRKTLPGQILRKTSGMTYQHPHTLPGQTGMQLNNQAQRNIINVDDIAQIEHQILAIRCLLQRNPDKRLHRLENQLSLQFMHANSMATGPQRLLDGERTPPA